MHVHAPIARIAPDEAAVITRRTARLSVAAALVLIALKAGAWLYSGSVSMLATLADSTLDLATSLFTLLAVGYAASPPDREHRFGHGKAEAFAGLFQAGLVAVSGALIAVEAGRRLLAPEPVRHGLVAIAVMGASIAVTAALVLAQTRAIRATGSLATAGDRAHYASDLAANLAVIAGVGAGAFLGWTWADAAIGLVVAAWLAWGAWGLARAAGDHLMDRELPDAERDAIRALALEDPRLLGLHDLRSRASGPTIHVQFHADLDPNITLVQAHDIIVAAEARIRAVYPAAEIIIHPDPRGAAAHGREAADPLEA